jgi:Bacterial dnaA protein helix-turn-helix
MSVQNLPVPVTTSYAQALRAHYDASRARLNRGNVTDTPVRCVSASIRAGGLNGQSTDEMKKAMRRLPDFGDIADIALDQWQQEQELKRAARKPPGREPMLLTMKVDRGHRRPLIVLIQYVVAQHFAIPVIEMRSKRRTRDVVWPRQVAMYIAKILTLESFPHIGRYFGGRDHTTVIHACRQVESRCRQEKPLSWVISGLIAQIEREIA